jgi:hypothetical protein
MKEIKRFSRTHNKGSRRLAHASFGFLFMFLAAYRNGGFPKDQHISTSSGIPLDSFHPDNIGWPKRVPCGAQKCFYRLKSDPQVGYLVMPSSKKGDDNRFTTLDLGWRLAERLRHEYNIMHFLLAPIVNATVSGELAEHLNYNMYDEKHQRAFSRNSMKKRKFRIGSTVHAQKVQLAPKRSLVIGCTESKVEVIQQRLHRFLSLVGDKEEFSRNVRHHFGVARSILRDVPCLVKDFQAMLDTQGDLYHIDFDRCYRSDGTNFTVPSEIIESCSQTLDEMEHQLQQSLQDNNYLSLE